VSLVIAAIASAGIATPAAHAGHTEPPPAGANDFSCQPSAEHPRPVVLVHGLSANMSSNWGYHSPRLDKAGYCVFALTYGVDPRAPHVQRPMGGVVRMEHSSRELEWFVRRVLAATGARKVDLVGHSEGTVMPRYYLERRDGAKNVRNFVALTPLWRGTEFGGEAMLRDAAGPELSGPGQAFVAGFCGSCPQFARGSDYLNDLNADGEAIPGIAHTNIITRYDVLVVPYSSGIMRDGGANIVLQRICPGNLSDHVAVAFDPVVTRLILNALDRKHARPVRC
jgi:pimeloyl-ACP methyl ester carboxylesterase